MIICISDILPGCYRSTSELKLRSDIPSYLLAPGSHHPRFAASFPYGLLSPSQLFSIYAVYYRLGKIHMSSVFKGFSLIICMFISSQWNFHRLQVVFPGGKWYTTTESSGQKYSFSLIQCYNQWNTETHHKTGRNFFGYWFSNEQ